MTALITNGGGFKTYNRDTKGFHRMTIRMARFKPSPFTLESLEHRTLLAAELVKDINPADLGQNMPEIVEYKGDVYFQGQDLTSGTELWKSDGTFEGTTVVKDILPGTQGAGAYDLTVANDLLFFTGNKQIYRTDGTEAGTFALPPYADAKSGLTAVGDTLFFSSTGRDLWKTDGTAEGTVQILAGIGSRIDHLTNVNGTLFFRAQNDTTYTLWRSDGTPEGTRRADASTTWSSDLLHLTPASGKLYFVTGQLNAYQLWLHDPATGTSRLVRNVTTAYTNPTLSPLAVLDDILYFPSTTT